MSELVKLEDSVVQRMEVEMRRYHITLGLVSGVLNGSEIVHLEIVRHNYHSSRVL